MSEWGPVMKIIQRMGIYFGLILGWHLGITILLGHTKISIIYTHIYIYIYIYIHTYIYIYILVEYTGVLYAAHIYVFIY